jgi:RNA-directed DNA polymerase
MILMRYADDIAVGFEHERTPGASGTICASGSRSSRCRLIRTRPAGSSSAASRQNDELFAGSANRRPSTFLALASSVKATAVGRSLSKEQHGAIARGQRSERSRRNCDGGCTNLPPSKGPGSSKWSEASSPNIAVPTNGPALKAFYYHVTRIWLRTLRRRGDHLPIQRQFRNA